ncbi:MAG: glycosyltransferase family 39 protein, partial [Anaerolineae bacterium]|nr:glycosyltransferase family 39 protein [Anaerolineae bacterium]
MSHKDPRISFTLLSIIALAFALNLHGLATDSFWGDEILTASFANQAPVEVIRWTADDIHPPLYYLLAGQFTRLTVPLGASQTPNPASDWLWRFPSVAAVVLAVAVTYKTAYCILRTAIDGPRSTFYVLRSTSSAAALLLALAPIAIKYGQEARMHALFMLFSALSTWLLFRAINRPGRWPRWLAYALALAATIYTMYFGFLILAAHGGYVLAYAAQLSRKRHSPFAIRHSIFGFASAT